MSKLNLNDGKFRPSIDGIENGKTSQVTGMNSILNLIMGNINYLKSLVDSKANKTIQVIAGNGLVGGGDLSTNRTLNIASADDGITVNADNIKLNIVDNATTDSATRAGSAKQIKLLSENKQNKTDSGLQTDSKEIVGAINENIWYMRAKHLTVPQSYNNLKKGGLYYSTGSQSGFTDLPKDYTHGLYTLVLTRTNNDGTQISFSDYTSKMWTRRTGGEWVEILTLDNKYFLGTSGISSVTYIQDSGTKTQGQGYIDKSTGQVYLCLETNTDTTITDKFMSITNVELGKKVESGFWKLNAKIINDGNFDILGVYEPGFYMPDSDGIQANWLNKPYVDVLCYGLLYQKQNGNRRSVLYIGSDGRVYTNVQLDNGSSRTWTGWKKAITNDEIIDNLTTSDKSKVLSANMGVELNINKSDRRNRISDDVSEKSKYVKLGTIGINIGNGRNLFSCIMIGGDNFGDRNSYKISLQVSGRGSTQNNVYIDAIDAINLSGISRSIDGYFIAKPISSNQMEIWYRGERYSRGFSLEAIYNNGFTINNQMSWIDDDEGTIVETGVYKIFKIKQVMHENNKLFLGNSGVSSILYIQDAGQKTAGNGYVDKTTGQLYLCKTTNSDTSVTSNFVLATNIEIAKRQHFTKTMLFDEPTGLGAGAITLSDNWENYDEFIVYGSNDNADHVGTHRFKKEDIEYSISKGQRYMIYGEANYYWLAEITTGSKTWASGNKWENCAIFRIIGIKYGG